MSSVAVPLEVTGFDYREKYHRQFSETLFHFKTIKENMFLIDMVMHHKK